MKAFILALVTILGCSCFSRAEVTFHDGIVVLRTGEIVSGKISVASFQLALVKIDEQLKLSVYPAHMVNMIRFYDETHDINRKFISIQSSLTKESSLYEKVVVGVASVLRKPRILAWEVSNVTVLDHAQYEYYVMWAGEIVPIDQVKKAFFKEWSKTVDENLAAYIKDEHLSLYNTAHVIQLIQYFNQLIKRKPLLAGL